MANPKLVLRDLRLEVTGYDGEDGPEVMIEDMNTLLDILTLSADGADALAYELSSAALIARKKCATKT